MRESLHDRVDSDFAYHAPNEAKVTEHAIIRASCLSLAHDLVDMLPESRELSLALTNLEQVMMWANAAIARH